MRCHFRSWHFSVVADLTDDVGSWGESGLTADIAETTRMTRHVISAPSIDALRKAHPITSSAMA
jgi:hypothetical protein